MFRFGEVVIDDATREVRVGDELRHLEPQAFDVLWLLATHSHRVVPKTEILDTVWGDQFVSESALTTRIKEIRRAVGDDGRTQGVIKNLRGTGYRFIAPIETVDDAPNASAGTDPPVFTGLGLRPGWVERRQGQRIAYASVGSGPPLVFMPGWISSIEAFADGSDPRAGMVARLAEEFTVTVFDRYGTGLSRAEEIDTSLEGSVAEVRAVVSLIDSADTTLFASSAAGPAALLAAAGNSQVGNLVLVCTYASGPALFTNLQNQASLLDLVNQSWGMGSRIIADMVVPGIDALTRSAFARFQRRTAEPRIAAGYLQQLYEADATSALATVVQPSLIMHYKDDPAIPFAGSRQLAMGLTRSEFLPLDGPFHTPPQEHVEHIAATVGRFVSEA